MIGCSTDPCSSDLVIRNGYVVDGSGSEGYHADVFISDGRIHHIDRDGTHKCNVTDSIDASGRVVTPGFIDVHAHGDPRQTPDFENFLSMGVTTIVLGQDGSSPWVRELKRDIIDDSIRTGVNVAYLAGHGTLRTGSGVETYSATPREIERLTDLVRDVMEAGCFGVSTGLEYLPGSYAESPELEGLAKAVGQHDGIIMSHLRSEDDDVLDQSLHELIEQGAYCRVHAAHLKSVYGKGKDRADEIIGIFESARERGVQLTTDMYPYLASYTGITIVFPEWAKTREDFEYARISREAELRRYLHQRVMDRNGPEATLFGGPPFTGMTLAEVADEANKSFVDILMQLGPQSISAAYFIMDEELQDNLFVAPFVMVGSDGSPTMHHPRGHGTFAKVLRKYVIDQKRLTLEEAVHKMTGLSAHTMKLQARGLVADGYIADINVIDTSRVQDRATFAEPHLLAEGFEWVLVNGKVARSESGDGVNRYGHVLSASEQR